MERKKRVFGILAILIAVVIFSTIFFHNSVIEEKSEYIKVGNLEPDLIFNKLVNYKKNITSINKMNPTMRTHYFKELEKYCNRFSQAQQAGNVECRALWTSKLRYNRIEKIEKFWGFNDTHYGAITLVLEGGLRAQFKPCSTASEDTKKEVIGSHLDFILGYQQTAPVIIRRFHAKNLHQFISNQSDLSILQETINQCGGEELEGPLIGWWEDILPVRTSKKAFLDREVLYKMRPILADRLEIAQKTSKFHSFYFLLQILRHGKDEFIAKSGDLISIDLDRSSFGATKHPMTNEVNFTWCYTCYWDENVYENLLASSFLAHPNFHLSHLLDFSLTTEGLPLLFSPKIGMAVDARVRMLLECMHDCMSLYGRENVLLNVPKTMSANEIINWYISHSQFNSSSNSKPNPKPNP